MFLRLWAWLSTSLRSSFALFSLQNSGCGGSRMDETLGRDAGTRRWDGPIADRQYGRGECAKVRFRR